MLPKLPDKLITYSMTFVNFSENKSDVVLVIKYISQKTNIKNRFLKKSE